MAMITPIRILADNGPMKVELARWEGKLVVVKELRGGSSSLANRLGREAAVVTFLEHENIVPLLAVQDMSLIFSYCPGMSLEEALDKGTLSLERSVKIATDILHALAYAHKNDVIHCDVKPSNILINGEKALLTDFGFAKDLALAAITQQGMSLGTPNYMPPEQFAGERRDPRSDLYAVGAVLYHMVTGGPPYGKNVFRFLMGDPTVELEALPSEAAPLVPVINKALSHNPCERYGSAEEMLSALSQALLVTV